ncbi:MAG: TolC family protein [Polyangia bacterium]
MKALAILLLVISSASASTLVVEEVEAAAERAFPAIIAARADQEAARGELQAAQGGFDPVLHGKAGITPFGYYEYEKLDTWIEAPTPLYGTTFYAGYRLGIGHVPDYYGEYETRSAGEVRAGVAVPLLKGGLTDRRRTGISKALLGIELAGLSVLQQHIEVKRAARQRYWEWVAAGKRLDVAQALLEIAEKRHGVIGQRVERGDLPAVERIDNEKAIAHRRAQQAATLRGVEQAQIELSLFLRDDAGQPVLVDPARAPEMLPDPSSLPALDDDMHLALERRPEPRKLRLMRAQGELDLRLARNDLLPKLDVSFTISKDLGYGSPTLRPVTGEVGIVLDVPLLFRSARGKVTATNARLLRTQAMLGYARDKVTAELRDAHSALRGAQRRVEATRRELELARELERLERQRFDLGDSTLFFVNQREQATAETALREIDALMDTQKAVIAYDAALVR